MVGKSRTIGAVYRRGVLNLTAADFFVQCPQIRGHFIDGIVAMDGPRRVLEGDLGEGLLPAQRTRLRLPDFLAVFLRHLVDGMILPHRAGFAVANFDAFRGSDVDLHRGTGNRQVRFGNMDIHRYAQGTQ